ncbi:MAG: sensor histidine kinase [Clostridium sp.]
MSLKLFDIEATNIWVRFLLLGLILVINLNEKVDIFFIVAYLLSIFILTLAQELVEYRKVKFILYIMALGSSLAFMMVDFQIGFVGVICLITEVVTKIKCGSAVFLSVIFVIIMGRLNLQDNVIYLILAMIDVYITNEFWKKSIQIKKEKEGLDELKEKFYKNIEGQKEYKSLSKQNLVLAKLDERNRIGSEMHDKIGHVLAGSIMRLEASKIVLDKDKEKGLEMMDEAISNLRTGMDDIRHIIHKITPQADEMGINKIKRELEEKFLNSNIKINFNALGNIDKIKFSEWIIFEKIIMELSTNTLKYAKCKNIYVEIQALNKITRLSFKDDGVGTYKLSKGFGLSKIEEMVIKNNGTITINTIGGFEVIIILKG